MERGTWLFFHDYHVSRLSRATLLWLGDIEFEEMPRIFNYGIGMVLVVEKERVEEIQRILIHKGETVHTLGEIVPRKKKKEALVWV